MASIEAQRKWRRKNKFVKRQLNIMARKNVHDYLAEIAEDHELRGKGEAVAFAVYTTMALIQQGAFNDEADRLHQIFSDAYRRDRETFAP
ncbi:MAG: hypothetical protein QGH73_04905 [Rhodospirillales bacterium]|jgi:hypothetical protein|nr:hypothetical protein [Rhodospirillaceae bacterium]MDP6429425.1 hypothetical protein [Rhodospirillales bacterium]MDP6643576.1 hypothetical protein [Rhodospirillales bacterium]MDP6840995.1 hypothetical protein [Rhodospirillales bacterium]|tara:strand:+ start:1036 stop:1305 length:270 start_codon:yes stop_codon:yes gene_type:complete